LIEVAGLVGMMVVETAEEMAETVGVQSKVRLLVEAG
jgi:hypothetical protein